MASNSNNNNAPPPIRRAITLADLESDSDENMPPPVRKAITLADLDSDSDENMPPPVRKPIIPEDLESDLDEPNLASIEAPPAPVEAPPAPVEAPPAPAPAVAPPAPVEAPFVEAPFVEAPPVEKLGVSAPTSKKPLRATKFKPIVNKNEVESLATGSAPVPAPIVDAPIVEADAPIADEPIVEAEAPIAEAEAPIVEAKAPIAEAPIVEPPVKKTKAKKIIVNNVNNRPNNAVALNAVKMQQYTQYTNQEILQIWDTEPNPNERDYIITEMKKRKLFPSAAENAWNSETGAYPDIIDPEFLQKLLTKREFADSLQSAWDPSIDACNDNTSFEVTPVQRFISNFMSPKTPYMSALLYHGVGVGKTCAGVLIAEAWLEFFPNKPVIIVTPPTIKEGFLRTIFDISKITIGEGDEPNSASQCTGITYMTLTNTLYERDLERIKNRVDRMIRKRYTFFGYIAFANYINSTIKYPPGISEKGKELYKKKQIRKFFSGRCLIVDEAHNLRDVDIEEDDEEDMELRLITGKKTDADNGKALTPFLRYVLEFSEGLKFCALTATPMYNTYREIIFMFNLLLLNDKKGQLVETDLFDRFGTIHAEGAKRIADVASHYVSFMRGENPNSFPVRLFPENTYQLAQYPAENPRGTEIPEDETMYFNKLPIVSIPLKGDALTATLAFTEELDSSDKGLSTNVLDKLVHACTFIVPETDQTRGATSDMYKARTDSNALETVFTKERQDKKTVYRAKPDVGAEWLGANRIGNYSPKFEFLLEKVRNAEGCIFVYSRFVHTGVIPLALVLEANGYTPYNNNKMLANGIQVPGGRQCALCPRKEQDHASASHAFTPAKYGMLTGDVEISPHNEQTIAAQRAFSNVNGTEMKIIIGSQISSEGVDLRFIREMHLIDAWYHLNKTEQILGRGIRFLSHCALPKEKRNNTVYLYAGIIPESVDLHTRETVDLYNYRRGFNKAVLIGNVTRIMKQASLDCNLNHDAIIISGQDPISQLDSQRHMRDDVNINDMPFTAMCDWIETCDYQCTPAINLKELQIDESSYDEFAARWRVQQVKERIRRLFSIQPFYQTENIWEAFGDIPKIALSDIFNDIVNNKSFQVQYNNQTGYIRYCNGYYIFQPNIYADLSIPLAIRSAQFPVKRDIYIPIQYDAPSELEVSAIRLNKSISMIWEAMARWVDHITQNSKYKLPPAELSQWYQLLGHMEIYTQIVEMIKWFHTSFHSSNLEKDPNAFRKAILMYLWDEWVNIEEQKWIIYESDNDVRELIAINQYEFDKSTIINRFINPMTGDIQYVCDNKNKCVCPNKALCNCKKYMQCDAGYERIIENATDEPIRKFKINTRTTGELYGFIVPKNGLFVMKHDNPSTTAMTKFRGLECANRSEMSGRHVANLIMLGDILRRNNKCNFELVHEVIVLSDRKIQNSRRACTIVDLVLRYMDELHINNKRWFFRAIEANYIGYKGIFRRKGR